MKYLSLFFIAVFLNSCHEKVVQLPETHLKNITTVLDVSPAYLFYDEETDSVQFNRTNLIGSTNWLVNVDKRLTLKQAMPHIIYLQNKRKKAGMHKNDNAKNYYSCSNPDIQNLAFIEFTELNYQLADSIQGRDPSNLNRIVLNIKSPETLFINDDLIKLESLKQRIKILSFMRKTKSVSVNLLWQADLSFQDYIRLKSKLLDLESDSLSFAKQEIIYN